MHKKEIEFLDTNSSYVNLKIGLRRNWKEKSGFFLFFGKFQTLQRCNPYPCYQMPPKISSVLPELSQLVAGTIGLHKLESCYQTPIFCYQTADKKS